MFLAIGFRLQSVLDYGKKNSTKQITMWLWEIGRAQDMTRFDLENHLNDIKLIYIIYTFLKQLQKVYIYQVLKLRRSKKKKNWEGNGHQEYWRSKLPIFLRFFIFYLIN